MIKSIVLLVVLSLVTLGAPVNSQAKTLDSVAFPNSCSIAAKLPTPMVGLLTSMDYCTECQAVTDEIITNTSNSGGSACESYGAGADYCTTHCSPCSFCVRYSRIAAFYCTATTATKKK